MPKDERDVLSHYLDGERLKVIPKKRSRKMVVLAWLVQRFAFDTDYTERQVNDLIARAHPDFATLRRELYDAYLMDRHDGIYRRRRAPTPPNDLDKDP